MRGCSRAADRQSIVADAGLACARQVAGGVSQQRDIPRLATRTFRRRFAGRSAPEHDGPRVLLWPDTFNDLFFPEVLEAATRVLERCGYIVTIPRRPLCCGRALYDFGMIDTARRLWRETLDTLALDIAIGTPVVGLEPSCVAAFRDELPNLFHEDARCSPTMTSYRFAVSMIPCCCTFIVIIARFCTSTPTSACSSA